MSARFMTCGGILLIVMAVLGSLAWAQAEPDAEDCKDHPLFSRMKNFYIRECASSAFDAVEFYLPEDQYKSVEGKKTYIAYALQEGSPKPSGLQICRNYENAVRSLGGQTVFTDGDYLSAKVVKSGREIWIAVQTSNEGYYYSLTIVEVEAMVQEVTANEMLDALNRDGFIALYINFDTGKADIKPESQPTLDEIAELLKSNPDLKVGIEGHTDNVGTAAANKALSEQRAKAVMAAVVALGVPAAQMTTVGWGQEKPIADNRSEDGRAKNRRVEIVKK